jgi:hypothetical protein
LKRAIGCVGKSHTVVAIECYTGLHDRQILQALAGGLEPQRLIETEREVFKSP